MTKQDAPHFFKRLALLAELFDVKNFSEGKSELYFNALEDMEWDDIEYALSEAAKRCKFMPRPVELREIVRGDDDTRIENAWIEFKQMARRIGSYGSPVFTDGAGARALIAIFGSWENACVFEASPEMWASKRKEFGRTYHAFEMRNETAPLRLTGFIERDNTARGFDTPGATRVTDSEIAGLLTDGNDDTTH